MKDQHTHVYICGLKTMESGVEEAFEDIARSANLDWQNCVKKWNKAGVIMSKHIEPFVYKIRVGWADCDPAFIAYTAKIPGFALEAIDAWWEQKIGYGWFQLNIDKMSSDALCPYVAGFSLSYHAAPRTCLRSVIVETG